MSHATVVDALAAALGSAPGRPLITAYGPTGDRVELSVATFDNWVAKLANLYCLDWELAPGDLISLGLPPGWRAVAALMAAWTAALQVTLEPDPVARVTLNHWDDVASDLPGQPDSVVLPRTAVPSHPALVDPTGAATHADLLRRGLTAAATIGLQPGGRLITDLPVPTASGLDIALLAPLATGSSVVLVATTSSERRLRLAEQERATCRHWAAPSAGG